MIYKDKYTIFNNRLYIPKDTFYIPQEEFKSLYDIKEVYIPKSVVYIGQRAFSCCFELQKVVFEEGSSCKFILDGAFEFCKNLSTIDLPDTVCCIGEDCFFLNKGIKTLILPQRIKEIGQRAFGLSSIEKIICNNISNLFVDYKSFYLMDTLKNIVINNINYDVLSGMEAISIIPISKKILKDVEIIRGYEISGFFTQKHDYYFICKTVDNKFEAMNNNLRLAFDEIEDKRHLNIADMAIKEKWDLKTKINYKQYAAMSKNCWIYTLEFMKDNNINEDAVMSIEDIIKISKGRRNYDVFLNFVKQYVIGGDTIN